MTRDRYQKYSLYLMALFAIVDEFNINAVFGLPMMDELYTKDGESIDSEYTDDKIEETVAHRNSLIVQAIEMKKPSAVDRVRKVLYR
jgi:predicted glycosyltransferase